MPADLLVDTGHPAGLRMIERNAFNDPSSPKAAVLIECGQHWEKSAAAVATDTTLRFLKVSGAVDPAWCDARLSFAPAPAQRVIRVTEPVVAKSMGFRFARDFAGLEVLVVYLAFRCCARHAGDFESLSIQDDRVLIVRRERGEVSRHELNRYWAQVVLHPSGGGRQAVLALRSHGRQVEFGRHLTEEQRCRMAGIIRAELGNR